LRMRGDKLCFLSYVQSDSDGQEFSNDLLLELQEKECIIYHISI